MLLVFQFSVWFILKLHNHKQWKIFPYRTNTLPGLALTGFRTTRARHQTIKKILLKKKLPQHWTVTTIKIKKNNNSKYQQGSMNLSGVISITKSNKTNKNIFTVTKILNSFKFFFIFSTNHSNNREIKINVAHLYAFITHAQYSAWVIKWAPFLRFGVTLVHSNLCMHTFITFSVCIRHIGFSPRRCRFFTKIVLFPNLIRC